MDKTVSSILPVVLVFVLLWIFFSFNILTEQKYENKRIKQTILIFGMVYFAWIIGKITIVGRVSAFPRKICLIPFYSYYKIIAGWQLYRLIQNIQNILMFVPLGFLGSILFEKTGKKKRVLSLLIIGLVISFAIEGIQYAKAIGLCEMDDIIHNVLGTMLGWMVYEFLRCLKIGSFKTSIFLLRLEKRQRFKKITRMLCVFFSVYLIIFFVSYLIHLYHVYVLWQ